MAEQREVSPSNAAWLALTTEPTLEPDLPICDPHHHLWEFRHDRVAHRYLLAEFLEDLNAGHNVVSTVFIECASMLRAHGPESMKVVGETEFVRGVAAMSASGNYGDCRIAAGIVGSANLMLGADVAQVLDAQVQAGGGRFRGIRHQLTWDAHASIANGRGNPVADTCLNPTFRAGFAELAPRQLSFEVWCYHHQIANIVSLAQAFPDTTLILNHFGGPIGVGPYAGRRDEYFASWQRDITALAHCDNVMAKLGGINMELNGFGWHERERPPGSTELMQATRPFYDHVISAFGVERCMFESNFPVDMVSCSYNVLWNSFKRLTQEYSPAEKAALFHDTATRVYRLDDETSNSA